MEWPPSGECVDLLTVRRPNQVFSLASLSLQLHGHDSALSSCVSHIMIQAEEKLRLVVLVLSSEVTKANTGIRMNVPKYNVFDHAAAPIRLSDILPRIGRQTHIHNHI